MKLTGIDGSTIEFKAAALKTVAITVYDPDLGESGTGYFYQDDVYTDTTVTGTTEIDELFISESDYGTITVRLTVGDEVYSGYFDRDYFMGNVRCW